jgi:predicted enzyme related to lactoylglutathione lyase
LAYHAALDCKNFNRRDFAKAAGVVSLASITGSTVAVANQATPSGGKIPKHPVVRFEIGCRDLAATKDFYQKMCGWPLDEQFQIADADIAGHPASLGHEPEHYTMVYVQVDDVAPTVAKAQSLGGKKIVGPITIPTGTFAWILDTQRM